MTNKLISVFDLTPHEANLYSTATQLGLANLADLSRISGIARTALYPPLNNLIKKGMISVVKVKKRNFYQALEPEQLRHLYEQKKVDLEQAITELTKSITVPDQKLEIRYFPGIDGLATASNLFISETKSRLIRTFDNPTYLPKIAHTYQLNKLIEQRVNIGIKLRMISTVPKIQSWMEKYIQRNDKELRETIFLSPKQFPFEASITVDDDRVMILHMKEKPYAIVIDSPALALTLTSIHEIIWSQYRFQ